MNLFATLPTEHDHVGAMTRLGLMASRAFRIGKYSNQIPEQDRKFWGDAAQLPPFKCAEIVAPIVAQHGFPFGCDQFQKQGIHLLKLIAQHLSPNSKRRDSQPHRNYGQLWEMSSDLQFEFLSGQEFSQYMAFTTLPGDEPLTSGDIAALRETESK